MNVDEVFGKFLPPSGVPVTKKAKLDDDTNLENENKEIIDINETNVKKLLSQVEKKKTTNQEMRTKYSDQPLMFLDSEIELYEAINNFMEVTNNPEYFSLLLSNKLVPTMLSLILHDNTDISLASVKFILQIVDPDNLLEIGQVGYQLVDELLKGQLISHCVDVLGKLDENNSEEADGVFSILNIIENITEVMPETKNEIATQKFLGWLLKRIQKRNFDENKLYVSEILSILLLNCKENQEKIGELDGIDTLLTQLSYYKRNDPNTVNEFEMMENLFDTLCYALFIKSNQERFAKGEGLQLMILMLRERKLSRNSALKVLDFSTNGTVGDETAQIHCNKFVDFLGLRVIFSYFMRTPDPKKTASTSKLSNPTSGSIPVKVLAKSGLSKSELEEHIINIMTSLVTHTSGTQKSRILSKFLENNCEKVERLIELHMNYLKKIDKIDIELEKKRANKSLWGDLSTEEIETQLNYLRMDGGLLVLQNVDIIIADICVNGDNAICSRVLELFKMHGMSPRSVSRIIEDYKNSLTLKKSEDNSTRDWLDGLLRKFVPLIP